MRFTLLFFFLFVLNCSSYAQKLSKQLQTKTWYCSCDFNTDSLILSETKTNSTPWEASFSPNGKVTLRHTQKKISNTVYSYTLKKETLRLFYNHKDSLINLNYEISAPLENGSYLLRAYYTMRYKKQKPTDIPPSDNFTLVKGTKEKTFYSLTELTVHRMKKGLKHDSMEYVCKGDFLELRADTLWMNVYQFSEHNFYKPHTDTNHYFSEFLFDSVIQMKIPIKEITRIYAQRERLNAVVNGLAVGALGAFVLSLPVALAVKSEPLNTIFTRTAVYSALSIPAIISVNIIFSKQKFEIARNSKKKNTWQFKSQSPGVLQKN